MISSGIRVGTPSITTQGMQEAQMAEVATLIADTVKETDDNKLKAVAVRVNELAAKFPAYPRA
jgi:glycine hydroxymethyltransferase